MLPPGPVLEDRLPGFSSETPPVSARGQGRPPPLPSRALPLQTGLLLKLPPEPPSQVPRVGTRSGSLEGMGGPGSPRDLEAYLGFPLRTPPLSCTERGAPKGLRPPPLSPAPVLGASIGCTHQVPAPLPVQGLKGQGPRAPPLETLRPRAEHSLRWRAHSTAPPGPARRAGPGRRQ